MQKKIILSVFLSLLAILGGLGVVSFFSVRESIERALDSHLSEAVILGKYFDQLLADNLSRLSYITVSGSIDFEDNDWEPERKALMAVHQYSLFTDLIFFLDVEGKVLLSYPQSSLGGLSLANVEAVQAVLHRKTSLVSDVHAVDFARGPMIFGLVPLFGGSGELLGIVGGAVNPRGFLLADIIDSLPSAGEMVIELLDSNGVIFASNDSGRVLTESDHEKFVAASIANGKASVGRCHRCHLDPEAPLPKTRDMLAFAPLRSAPWGVAVRVPEATIFRPSTNLKRWFAVLCAVSVFSAVLLLLDITKNFVQPIRLLIRATERMGEGNLSEPVRITSRDEIGILASSFDAMRQKLASSLEQIRRDKIELEERVMERTRDLGDSREKLSRLLLKVITAEEEERKRVARTLHDETGQSLNAAMFSLDYVSAALEGNDQVKEKIRLLRTQLLATVNGVRQMIEDLRPTLLDELGLGPAVEWLIERHLSPQGIRCRLEVQGSCPEVQTRADRPLDCERTEVVLFRVIQEAVINIARFAQATEVNLTVLFDDSGASVDIADNGKGFEVQAVWAEKTPGQEMTHFGLFAMHERIGLLGGKIVICSRPGDGTQISLYLPL